MSEASAPSATREGLGGRGLATILVAWLIPGSGHFFLGRRPLALAFCLIVLAEIVLGLLLDGNLYRVMPGRPLTILATLASMGMGAPYFLMRFVAGYEGEVMSAGFEYGTAFLLTAGLMNLLLVLDVWDRLRGRRG